MTTPTLVTMNNDCFNSRSICLFQNNENSSLVLKGYHQCFMKTPLALSLYTLIVANVGDPKFNSMQQDAIDNSFVFRFHEFRAHVIIFNNWFRREQSCHLQILLCAGPHQQQLV